MYVYIVEVQDDVEFYPQFRKVFLDEDNAHDYAEDLENTDTWGDIPKYANATVCKEFVADSI